MALWLIQALKLLGTAAVFGVGSELVSRVTGDDSTGMTQFAPFPGAARAVVHPGTVHDIQMHKRRRRRRRALTASDKADIAFIAGTLGKAAGAQFAVALGARSR